jgi:hypothetical protein
MLPLILAGLAGAAITAIVMVEDEETIEMLDKAKQALNLSQDAIIKRDIHIEELEQLISELTVKSHLVNSEIVAPVNMY